MDDSHSVQVVQPLQQLQYYGQSFRLRVLLLLEDAVEQIASLVQITHTVDFILLLINLVNAHHAVVIYFPEDVYFLQKALLLLNFR